MPYLVNIIGLSVLLAVAAMWMAARLFAGSGEDRNLFGIGLGLMASCLAWVLVTIGLVMAFGPLAGLVWFVSLVTILEGMRFTRKESLLWVLSAVTQRGIPITEGLEDFAYEYHGSYRRKVLRLAELLSSGAKLPDAVRRVRGLLSTQGLVAVQVGDACGGLGAALQDAVLAAALRGPAMRNLWLIVLYLLSVIFAELIIITFLALKIVPAFQRIFQDFNMELPWITQALFDFGAPGGWGLVPLLLMGLMSLAYALLLYGFVAGVLPILGIPLSLSPRVHSSTILRNLAVVVDYRRPLSVGLAAMSESFPSATVRRRLERAEQQIREGVAWTQALRQAGLFHAADAAVLEAAERVGNLAWALREVAASIDRRIGYRLRASSELLFPLAIVGLGMVVLIVGVGCLWPMFRLIEQLA